jgi:DNA polymerase-3 subunit delta
VGVYLLLGDDEERKARSVAKLRGGRDLESYDASETTPEAVVAACNSPSLFGDGTVVLLKNLDAWNAAQKAVIVDYLDDPSPDTHLVMLGEKLGARERLLAAVKKVGEVHELKQPTGRALAKWAVGYAKKRGLDLPEEVAAEIVARCADDKARVALEVEKLSLYAEGPATLDDVDALVPPNLESNIFAFVDSLASDSPGDALRLLEALLATGEPLLRILFMIRRQLRLIARAKALYAEGSPRQEVASTLKVPPFVARKLEEQARAMSEEELEGALDLVLNLEWGLKGGSDLPDMLQVELAVLSLASAEARK